MEVPTATENIHKRLCVISFVRRVWAADVRKKGACGTPNRKALESVIKASDMLTRYGHTYMISIEYVSQNRVYEYLSAKMREICNSAYSTSGA
jgi:hypothetical protein